MDYTPVKNFIDKITAWRIPCADVCIYINNQPSFRYSAGYSDLEKKTPLQRDALYHIYSATKLITVISALKLYEQGRYSLNDPLYEYIPEYRHMYLQTNNCEASRYITIENLFTMTAGLSYNIHSKSIMDAKKATEGKCPTLTIAKAIAKEPLLANPGEKWIYGFEHDVLGAFVEVVSGKRFSDYVYQNILMPLNMTNTSFHLDNSNINKMCKRYNYDQSNNTYTEMSLTNTFVFGTEYDSGGGGLISSVDDYIIFASALANNGIAPNGEQLLKPKTIELMRTNRLSDNMLGSFDWPHMQGYGYGLGVRTLLDPKKANSKSPIGEFGWGGAAGAYVLADPENKLAVFYAQHMLNDQQEYVHPNLRNAIYDSL